MQQIHRNDITILFQNRCPIYVCNVSDKLGTDDNTQVTPKGILGARCGYIMKCSRRIILKVSP